MAKCKYESKVHPGYECSEDALPDSKDGYCIFHERSKDKDIDKFNAGIKAKIENKDYDFTGYYFPGEADFTNQEFEDAVRFEGAEFQGGALFDGAEFQGWASFDGAEFKEWASFAGAEFQGVASFYEAKFQGEAWFEGAEFQGAASFDRAEFQGRAWFGGAQFQGKAWFDEAKFQNEAWFNEAEFQGDASFEGAEFQDRARFDEAEFHRMTLFNGAKFQGLAGFLRAKFHGAAWFEEAKFQGRALFAIAEFQRTASFRGADFKHLEEAEVAYRKAKISWQREGDYAEAGYYHLKEMRARRKSMVEIRWPWLNRGLNYLEEKAKKTIAIIGDKLLQLQTKISRENPVVKKLVEKLDMGIFSNKMSNCNEILFGKLRRSLVLIGRAGDFTIDLISGYGEQPWKVILTALVIIGIFSLLYLSSGAIVFSQGSEVMRLRGPLDALYFSVVTFTTLGYGDWHPDPNHWIRYFAMAEAFTGAFMIALFVLCFARKWMR